MRQTHANTLQLTELGSILKWKAWKRKAHRPKVLSFLPDIKTVTNQHMNTEAANTAQPGHRVRARPHWLNAAAHFKECDLNDRPGKRKAFSVSISGRKRNPIFLKNFLTRKLEGKRRLQLFLFKVGQTYIKIIKTARKFPMQCPREMLLKDDTSTS